MLCDSYNYHMGSRNITSVTFNFAGELDYQPGQCWCTQAVEYTIANAYGRDSAFWLGHLIRGMCLDCRPVFDTILNTQEESMEIEILTLLFRDAEPSTMEEIANTLFTP